jgi:uncharacterized protein (TIGR03083 family)
MPSASSDLARPPFLDHLAQESARFRAVLSEAPAGLRVPTCPEWDADDLIWHLGEVQWFWGEIASGGLTTQEEVDALGDRRVERPTDRAGLLEHFDRSSRRLHGALAALQPATELWMWADEHTAGYIARRQAHEAMIHRLDAELTVGTRTPLDCRLAADGVDEALRVMRGYGPEPELTHEAVAGSVSVATVDAMHTWTVTPVRVTGSYGGTQLDIMRLLVGDGPDDASVAEICGSAADLDCWLWNRPGVEEITRDGDAAALAAIDAVLNDSID